MATITAVIPRPTSAAAGIWGWITTVDHKRIGILYGSTALIFLLLSGIEAGVLRVQLATPDSDLVGPGRFNQMFTMHATVMIFMVIMPMGVAFFNFVVPLAIGARDVAFPRLNALSYWIFLFGAILMHFSFIVDQVPDAGWFSYANLTEHPFSPDRGLDFWAIGLLILGTSSVAGGLNFVVTIINLRAPGMTLMRMPVFVWMTLITSILLILAMPVITVGLIELVMDRNFGTHFFIPSAGGDPILWQHLFWVFGHPEVYILILPPMGIVSEILPTFSKKPLFGYPVVVFSGIVIGIMGWAVWSHHMFTVGLGPIANSVFTITTMLIAVPTGVKIFNWMATLWKGAIEFTTPMLFALGFVTLFIIGGLSGVSHAVSPSDFQQQDTYYVVAHIHYVLFGGSIFGIFAGIYYWFPKLTGKTVKRKAGQAPLLADVHRYERDLLPNALRWDERNAPPHLHLRFGVRLGRPEHAVDLRLLHHIHQRLGIPLRLVECSQRPPGKPRPLGRPRLGVEHFLASASLQLRPTPSGEGPRRLLDNQGAGPGRR